MKKEIQLKSVHRLSRGLLFALLISLSAFAVAGCDLGLQSDSQSIASSTIPVYRLAAARYNDTDARDSGYAYSDGFLAENYEYGEYSSFTYKNGGRTRKETTSDGQTYTEEATCDNLGRITRVKRSSMGSVFFDTSYAYYANTWRLKTRTIVTGPYVRVEEYDESGFVTSIESSNKNTGERKTAYFTYEELSRETTGYEFDALEVCYQDYDGNRKYYVFVLGDNGLVLGITDGTDFVQFYYEEVDNPTVWLFTETESSEAMLGYTTRGLFDTWA